jgi:hypothetical protein
MLQFLLGGLGFGSGRGVADRLEDLLRSCAVRVTNGGATSGAGFFVAPGRVITCVHVVGTGSALTVHWERDGTPGTVFAVSDVIRLADRGRPIPALDCDYPDIAVLTVTGITGHPCVAIDAGWPGHSDVLQAFGYPAEGGATLLTPAKLTYRGLRGTWPTLFLDLGWDTIRRGMSGAPVLNLRTGGVCGVVVASRDPQQPAGALAVPWSAIETDLDDEMAANAAFHRRDGRWAALRQLAGAPSSAETRQGAGAVGMPTIGAGAAGWAAGSMHGRPHEQGGAGPASDDDHDDHPAPDRDGGHHHEDDDSASEGPGSGFDSGADDSAPTDIADDDPWEPSETDDDDLW